MTSWRRICLISHRLWLTLFAISILLCVWVSMLKALQWKEEKAIYKERVTTGSHALGPPIELSTEDLLYLKTQAEGSPAKVNLADEFEQPAPSTITLSQKAPDFDWKPIGFFATLSGILLFLRFWIPWLIGYSARN